MFKLSRFEFGACAPLHIRTERIVLGLRSPVRLLYASDLHLGWPWTKPLMPHLLTAARCAAPDAIVLGGDLADRRRALEPLRDGVAGLACIAPVYAVPGNHDQRLGSGAVRAAVQAAGAVWLAEDENDDRVHLRADLSLCATIQQAPPAAANSVLCAHHPSVFPTACRAGHRLVLAGHLHGGQCVLATRRSRLYPGAWFSRWTGLRFSEGRSTMLVSRGAADTLPLRWNCPREVILCEIV